MSDGPMSCEPLEGNSAPFFTVHGLEASLMTYNDPLLASDVHLRPITYALLHYPSHAQCMTSVAAGRIPDRPEASNADILDHERSNMIYSNGIPRSSNTQAPDNRSQPPSAQPAGVRPDCPHHIFQEILVRCLRSGGEVGGVVAAREAGFPHKATQVKRRLKTIRLILRETDEATLEARLEAVWSLQPAQIGNPDFLSRNLFDKDTLNAFTRNLNLFADLGFPHDIEACQDMMTKHLIHTGTPDWMADKPHVSESYVFKFLKNNPDLGTDKASNIDPIRAKKATPEV